jgi:hypothetical protein
LGNTLEISEAFCSGVGDGAIESPKYADSILREWSGLFRPNESHASVAPIYLVAPRPLDGGKLPNRAMNKCMWRADFWIHWQHTNCHSVSTILSTDIK